MHLLRLQDDGEFSLVKFLGNSVPAYAILSHTWGSEEEEVTYQDLQQNTGKRKKGYRKLTFCGEQAAKDGLEYFWIDTCCIDKTSSAELSEAITSMFRWYNKSAQCYVYLSDVSTSKRKADHDQFSRTWEPAFRTSHWFSRGWTLQELIAPHRVTFFSKEGNHLGNKSSLERLLHLITCIPVPALQNAPLDEFDVEQRMSWIGNRQTTREEDRAYSMLGIVGISMLPMYGEGEDRALRRLRKEIREGSGGMTHALNEDQKQSLLDSLRFEQIDARQMTIKNAHTKTCKWLLENRQYLDWLDKSKLDEHHGFLWIKGKAGTGKSTLMKFAFFNARKMMKDRIILSFFFNARGEDMEKSTIGAYRSLLLQLLERLPALQSTLNLLGLSESNIGADHRWNIGLLEMLLEQAVQMLGKSQVVCFIDALDECDEEQVRHMIQFFERIGEIAVSTNIQLQVCFSSRHYPHVTIRKGLELVLEGQEGHSQDIANYIKTELKIGQTRLAQQTRLELQEKASGIFMWVVLVIGILNKEWDRGQIHTLRRKLQEIPGDLHELFRDILTRDSHNKEGLVLCIQWMLFAKQPLNPEQFYHAILSGVDLDAVSALDSEEITNDVLKRFILDCSKGLVEITMAKKQKVQFIHESVRDFLIKENGLSKIWPELGTNFQGQSHERLKQCCSYYISLDFGRLLNLPDKLPKASSQQAASMRSLATQKFPLLEYAVHNVLHHANTAQGSDISQEHFLDSFPPPQWVKLDNLFEKHEVRRHSGSVSCLYLLAELNMANLIKVCRSVNQCIAVEEAERYGCPLFAAAATGSKEALELCMKSTRTDQPTGILFHEVDEPKSQQELAQRITRRDFVYSKNKGLLLNAAELGHDSVLTYFLNLENYDIDSKDSRGRTALWWASKNGCKHAVSSLLVAGSATVNSKDKDNRTPLHIAVETGNDAIVALLLGKGADINVQGGRCGNALRTASADGQEAMVKLLLEKGAEVNAQGGQHGNALQAASAIGNKAVVKLLLEKGAEVNAQGGEHGNALQAALTMGQEVVVKLLLEKGANINVQDRRYSNVLHTASADGQEAMVKLLLEKGAEVNAQGGHYGNALQAASWRGREAVVKLLLEKGAKVNAQGGYYGNALQAALSNGQEAVVKLLLEKGAEVNAQGGYYGNALQAASAMGKEAIVKLLLEKGAEVNAQGGQYGNALHAASSRGREAVVNILRAKGAK
jgi:ankyrin repeat protein